MKKQYAKPEITIVPISRPRLLAGSKVSSVFMLELDLISEDTYDSTGGNQANAW